MNVPSRPRPPAIAGLTSVIVPCLAPWATVRRCLSALFRHTRPDWELIAVTRDGAGSPDPIAAYLAGLGDGSRRRVEVVTAPSAPGYRAAIHRGLREARGEFLALVHPATVVTDAWLDQLTALALASPRIGLVGPMSNGAPPPQGIEPIPYEDPASLEAYAAEWRRMHRGRWFKADGLWTGCLLAKRALLEDPTTGRSVRAEGLRPRRLALRARRADAEMAIAHDLYVHHEGTRRRSRPPSPELRLAAPPALSVPATPAGRRCRVSLTMIVKNEEANLPACLGSVRGVFDEVIVLDTGSTDRTAEIARDFGARVFDFAWVDDFAAARNASLARATGDYAFWLDADDVMDPPERDRLVAMFDRLIRPDRGYVVRCACDPEPDGTGATVVDHVRLFPVREDVRWTYRVHEQILPSLRQAGLGVEWTDVVVRHTGYTDRAVRHRKLGRDRAILAAELEDRPDDPFVLFNLGSIALEVDDPRQALAHFRRSLAGSAPEDSITRKLHALIARSHQLLGEPEAALAACGLGLADTPDDAELWFRMAVLHRHLGQPGRAESAWRKVLTIRRPERFSSVDVGIYGHLTRRNLAVLAEERGDRSEARALWHAVLGECPGDREALAVLGRLDPAATPGTTS